MRYRNLTLSAIALVLLAACGGGGGGSSGPQSTQQTAIVSAPPPLAPVVHIAPGTQIGASQWPDGSPNIHCVDIAADAEHYSVHVSILRDGAALALPANIGFDGCYTPVYTEDRSGVVHLLERPKEEHTLADLFRTWGQSMGANGVVAGMTVQPIHVFVIDTKGVREVEVNPAAIVLKPGMQIVITLGALPSQLPQFHW